MRTLLLQFRGYSRDLKLFLCFSLLVNTGFAVFGLVFNLYLYELGYREDALGLFNGIQILALALVSVGIGAIVRRVGIWTSLITGLVLYAAACVGLALATGFWLIVLLAALSGAGLALATTLTMPFVIEYAPVHRRQEASALAFSVIALATTAGALVGGLAPSLFAAFLPGVAPGTATAFRCGLLAGSALCAAAILPLLRMTEPRQPHAPAPQFPNLVEEPVHAQHRARRDMWTFVTIAGVMAISGGIVIPFYNVYLFTFGANARDVGYVYALAGLFAALAGLFAPALARRAGSLHAVFLVRILPVPFFILLLLAPGYAVAVVAYLARAVLTSMNWPIDSTFTAEVLPRRMVATVFGLRSASWNFGWAAASFLGGWLIVQGGYELPIAGLIVFAIASAIAYQLYFSRHPLVRTGAIQSALPATHRVRQTAPAPQAVPPVPTPRLDEVPAP